MKNITKIISQRIAQFLNSATATVVHSYERYLSSDLPEDLEEDPKDPVRFKAFHDAGKSAASHLDVLLKLAKATDDSDEQHKISDEKARVADMQERIRRADAEINKSKD